MRNPGTALREIAGLRRERANWSIHLLSDGRSKGQSSKGALRWTSMWTCPRRGKIGSRTYYSCLMPLSAIPNLFKFMDWVGFTPEDREQRILNEKRIPD